MRTSDLPGLLAMERLRQLADDDILEADDGFRRMLGLTPSLPRTEAELVLGMYRGDYDRQESGRSAGPRTGPVSPRHRR